MSPYNEDNTVDSSGYQGYHRSHHRSHTQDSQSEKIEVTIQGHTEESDSSQIEKKTKISLPWKHKGHILIFSLILSIFSIAVPALQTLPIIYSLKTFILQKCLPMVAYLTLTFLRQVDSFITSWFLWLSV